MSDNLIYINSELISAIRDGNLNIVKKIINSVGLYYSEDWDDGFVLLRDSLKFGHNEVAKLLLEFGARVHSKRSRRHNTALYFAVRTGDAELVEMVLRKGVNVNEKDERGMTPLNVAADNGHLHIVRVLLDHEADIDAKSKYDKTPLFMAVNKGHSLIVKELLRWCPDINDKANRKSLSIAVLKSGEKYKRIVDDLLKYGFTLNSDDKSNSDLLFKSIQIGNYKMVKNLLDFGANINTTQMDGSTLLHCAAKNDQEEITQLLLRHKCHANASNKYQLTPIWYAVERVNLGITKMLLMNKATVNCVNSIGETLLHKIVSSVYNKLQKKDNEVFRKDIYVKQAEVIAKLLLSEGVEVNAKDTFEMTALHCAAMNGLETLIHILLNNKADIDSKTELDHTPLYFATADNNIGMARLLLERGANVNVKNYNEETLLYEVIKKGNIAIVELLLNFNADVNCKNCSDKIPLFEAASLGKLEIARMLLNKGADIDAKSDNGLGVLHYAAQSSPEMVKEMIKLFIEANADVNARSNDGRTPLYSAVMNDSKNGIEVLLKFGADINVIDIYGNTLLECETRLPYLMKEHAVKLLVAGLYVTKENLQYVKNDFISQFRSKYEIEINNMKSKVINNTTVSFYDILTKNKNKLSNYFNNENILRSLESGDYKIEFPLYADIITLQYKKGMKRKRLLGEIHQFFNSFPNSLILLPHICTKEIFLYLNDKDLSIF